MNQEQSPLRSKALQLALAASSLLAPSAFAGGKVPQECVTKVPARECPNSAAAQDVETCVDFLYTRTTGPARFQPLSAEEKARLTECMVTLEADGLFLLQR